jgi:nucleoside-diphosphate-sugar epimerase
MKLLILGAGNAGLEVATSARARGWQIVATTTRESRLSELREFADEARVVLGADREAVAQAAQGCDAVLVSVSPPIMQARTAEERQESYRDVLVESCRSAAAACDQMVFLSSISVYGDGRQEAGQALTEQSPRAADSTEPSTIYYSQAEDAVLSIPGGCVLRLPDIYGHPRDIDFTARVALAHEHMGGSVSFAAQGRLHRIHVEDVAEAVIFALTHQLIGVYNCVPDLVASPTNKEVFDRLADESKQPRLDFRGELATPIKQVSSARLRAAGFAFAHPDDPIH